MKTIFKSLIIGMILFSSCSVNETILENTCWKYYKAEEYTYDIKRSIIDYAESENEGNFVFYFEKRNVTINNSETSTYVLKDSMLNLSGVDHNIILLNDTLMITIDYINNNKLYPHFYNFYKKIECSSIE